MTAVLPRTRSIAIGTEVADEFSKYCVRNGYSKSKLIAKLIKDRLESDPI